MARHVEGFLERQGVVLLGGGTARGVGAKYAWNVGVNLAPLRIEGRSECYGGCVGASSCESPVSLTGSADSWKPATMATLSFSAA